MIRTVWSLRLEPRAGGCKFEQQPDKSTTSYPKSPLETTKGMMVTIPDFIDFDEGRRE